MRLDLDEIKRRAQEHGWWEAITVDELDRLVAMAEAGRTHYEEHRDCDGNPACICQAFVAAFRAADGGE